jgi:hypothetical protein
MPATMTSVPWRNRLRRPRWLRSHIITRVITSLVAGNLLLIVILVLVMR